MDLDFFRALDKEQKARIATILEIFRKVTLANNTIRESLPIIHDHIAEPGRDAYLAMVKALDERTVLDIEIFDQVSQISSAQQFDRLIKECEKRNV